MQGIPGHKKANLPLGRYMSCGFERVLFFPEILNTTSMNESRGHWFIFFILYVIVKPVFAVKTDSFDALAHFLSQSVPKLVKSHKHQISVPLISVLTPT